MNYVSDKFTIFMIQTKSFEMPLFSLVIQFTPLPFSTLLRGNFETGLDIPKNRLPNIFNIYPEKIFVTCAIKCV